LAKDRQASPIFRLLAAPHARSVGDLCPQPFCLIFGNGILDTRLASSPLFEMRTAGANQSVVKSSPFAQLKESGYG